MDKLKYGILTLCTAAIVVYVALDMFISWFFTTPGFLVTWCLAQAVRRLKKDHPWHTMPKFFSMTDWCNHASELHCQLAYLIGMYVTAFVLLALFIVGLNKGYWI